MMMKLSVAVMARVMALIALAAAEVSFSCPAEDVTFELVTGHVFRSPGDILDTRTGVLHLEECISGCRANSSCLSVNYETGLCVMFDSSAELKPESLATSQFPVFTLYASKTCVRGAGALCGGREWSFDRVAGNRAVAPGYARAREKAESRERCLEMCLTGGRKKKKKFICRSATYNRRTGDCTLSDLDRRTAFGSTGSFIARSNTEEDYFESNCGGGGDGVSADPAAAICKFRQVRGRILKTVDSVYSGVRSTEECKRKCVAANYRCHTYDFGATGPGICRLSHHSSATLRHVDDPYLLARGAHSYEMGACFNVTIECQANYMVANVAANRMFDGKVYGKTRPNSCQVNVRNSMEFSLYIGYNDVDCDVRQEIPGRFASDIVIQHHDMIVTGADVGLKVRCNYNLENRTVTNDENLAVGGGVNDVGTQNGVVDTPTVTLRVADRAGRDISSAKVGDPLALRFEIAERSRSPYEIFVRDLVAMDGLDSSEIQLVDDRGCPTDYTILGTMREVNGSGQVLQANFDAFKFPTSDIVQFRALVTPCIPRCDPVDCRVTDYYGREKTVQSRGKKRRRRRADESGTTVHLSEKELMVAGVIHISDEFELGGGNDGDNNGGGGDAPFFTSVKTTGGGDVVIPGGGGGSASSGSGVDYEKSEEGQESCMNTLAAALGAAVFLLIQCVLIGVWTVLCRRRRKSDKETDSAAAAAHDALSEMAGSSLRDYDPYFAEDVGAHVHHRRRAFDREYEFGLFPAKGESRKNRRHHRNDGEMVTSGPSSLGSVGPRNLT